jgi:hypothetical protein
VEATRQIQRNRFLVGAKHSIDGEKSDLISNAVNASPINCNPDMRQAEVRQFSELDETSSPSNPSPALIRNFASGIPQGLSQSLAKRISMSQPISHTTPYMNRLFRIFNV